MLNNKHGRSFCRTRIDRTKYGTLNKLTVMFHYESQNDQIGYDARISSITTEEFLKKKFFFNF